MKTLTTSRNFFKAAILVLSILLNSSIFTQDWLRIYGTNGVDIANDNVIDQSGNVYVTGLTNYPNSMRCTLVKYSPGGSLLWERTFSGVGSGYGMGNKLLIDNQGNIFVFATIFGYAQNNDFYIIKYDQNGNVISSARYGDAAVEESFADAAFDNNGNILVALAARTISNGNTDIILMRFNTMCVVQQYLVFNQSTWNEYPAKLLTNYLGDIFIAGSRSLPNSGRQDILVAKFNSSLQYQTEFTYAGYANENDFVTSACLHPAGGIVIGGITRNSTSYDFTIFKLTDNLTSEWMRANNFQQSGGAVSDVIIANSTIYATGSVYTGNRSFALTAAYSFSGSVIWSNLYSRDTVSNVTNTGQVIKADAIGNVYAAGTSGTSSTGDDAMILKFGPSGSLLFAYNYNGTAFGMDRFNALVVDNSGKLYASGITFVSTNNPEFMTVKLTGFLTGVTGNTNEIPDGFNLSQNYPNPFNPSTKISFSIPKASQVKLVVYDAAGREVETLVNEQLHAGSFEVDFNASKLTSGVYFYKLVTEGFTGVKKMILVK